MRRYASGSITSRVKAGGRIGSSGPPASSAQSSRTRLPPPGSALDPIARAPLRRAQREVNPSRVIGSTRPAASPRPPRVRPTARFRVGGPERIGQMRLGGLPRQSGSRDQLATCRKSAARPGVCCAQMPTARRRPETTRYTGGLQRTRPGSRRSSHRVRSSPSRSRADPAGTVR